MCGICGVFSGGAQAFVEAMVAAMRHRGPDDQGTFADDSIAMGMTRLAVIDISFSGHQPMSSDDSNVWIVYNGETYNFLAERQLLENKGYRFSSGTDSEVVLKMYLQYGDSFLERMRGMFALAIYDRRRGNGRERLLLARDQIGVKPLLYSESRRGLVFASEMKGILASGLVDTTVDRDSLWFLLTYGSVPQPRTILREVRMLLPGHRFVVEAGTSRLERYWALKDALPSTTEVADYNEQVRRVREQLEAAVAEQLVSDVPIGAFLSGGIDSTALVALMAKTMGARVKTFSIGFAAEGRHLDETDEAGRVAGLLGTDHHRIEIRAADVRDRLADFVRGLDQPSVDGLNSYLVSSFAAKHVTVAISGTGGDELFAGYPWFGNVARSAAAGSGLRDQIVTRTSQVLSRLPLGCFPKGMASRAFGRIIAQRSISAVFFRQLQIENYLQARSLLVGPAGRTLCFSQAEKAFALADELSDSSSLIARLSALCLRSYLVNQLLRDIDAVSMASSLEVRVPFLDVRLTGLALSLPDGFKLGNARNARPGSSYRQSGAKRVLIDAVRDLLPPDIDLQPKRGFSMPLDNWLRGPLAEICEDVLSRHSTAARGILDPAGVEAVLRRFVAQGGSWVNVWVLIIFELWCREVLQASATR